MPATTSLTRRKPRRSTPYFPTMPTSPTNTLAEPITSRSNEPRQLSAVGAVNYLNSKPLIEGLDELIGIARAANIPAEVYHLKAAGRSNWGKLDAAIARIEAARAAGLKITADMYTYVAGATGLDAAMPPWVQEGGYNDWARRLRNPAMRERVRREMVTPTTSRRNRRMVEKEAWQKPLR